MNNNRKFLLFCPDITGHRNLYCRRLLNYLNKRDIGVALAVAGRPLSVSPFGRTSYGEMPDSNLQLGEVHAKNEIISLTKQCGIPGSLKQLRQIAKKKNFTDVIHIDADAYRLSLAMGNYAKDEVRHYLLLICTDFIDWRHRISTQWELYTLVKVLFKKFERGRFIANREFGSRELPRITSYLVRKICQKSRNVRIITTDERLPDSDRHNITYIPELGTSHWDCARHETQSNDVIYSDVQEFLKRHPGKRVICMLGDLEQRKGYQSILQLCAAEVDTVCIRIGRTKPTYRTTWESIDAKESLLAEKRIFEYDSYLPSWDLFRSLLMLQDVVILPYIEFYRTSGVFVDALVAGKPVIVPDEGLMGWRVQAHELGTVFKSGSLQSLKSALRHCIENIDNYRKNVIEYGRQLDIEKFYEQLDASFEIKKSTAL